MGLGPNIFLTEKYFNTCGSKIDNLLLLPSNVTATLTIVYSNQKSIVKYHWSNDDEPTIHAIDKPSEGLIKLEKSLKDLTDDEGFRILGSRLEIQSIIRKGYTGKLIEVYTDKEVDTHRRWYYKKIRDTNVK